MSNNKFKKKVLIASNSSWNLFNFRYPIIKNLLLNNYDVILCGKKDETTTKLIDLGCSFVNLRINSNGRGPIEDFILFLHFLYIFFREKPNLFMPFTVKPNVYGGLAANFFNIPVINTVTGLGSGFLKDNSLRRIICFLYKISLRRSTAVFFQNSDDLNFFVSTCLVKKDICFLVPGSGVNIQKFNYIPIVSTNPFKFLFVGRLLKDKGILEYLQAAKLMREKSKTVTFLILGSCDKNNPNSISLEHILEHVEDGIIEYCGTTEDVFCYFKLAHCVVLPSFREGIPKVLLEAAAVGRPLIATDVPGCREVVEDTVNGYLCAPNDANDLASKMSLMHSNSLLKLNQMGQNGRTKVENYFDENLVVDIYMRSIKPHLLNK